LLAPGREALVYPVDNPFREGMLDVSVRSVIGLK
jgi:hypothetical protein